MDCLKRLNPILIFLLLIFTGFSLAQSNSNIPHLNKQGRTTQLIVDGEPFLILGGELGNSSFTSLEYMEPIWPKLNAMNFNTVLAPVYWELIEPVEGEYDFKLYDKLIAKAREHKLKLVLLWFGSWKNSMSSHAPEYEPNARNDEWKVIRYLNGDQIHQGRHI